METLKQKMMNKKFFILPAILLSLIFTSCSDDDDDVTDRLTTISDIPVNADVSVDYLPINLFEIPIETEINLRDLIEDELGTDEALNQVKNIRLKNMKIDLVGADDQEDFDFIDAVTLGVRTNDLEYKEVATLDPTPDGVTTLDMNTNSDLYIDDYAKSENMKLVVKFKSTEDASNLDVKLKMKFTAKLDPSL